MSKQSSGTIKYLLSVTIKFLKQISLISKSYIVLSIMYIIFVTAASFINVIMPKFIIDELLGNQNITRILAYIIFTVMINFAINIISSVLNHNFGLQNIKVMAGLNIALGNKSLELDYEQTEDRNIMELKERAAFTIQNQNAIERMMNSIRGIVQSIVTIIGLVAIIMTLDIWIILFIVFILFISFFIFRKQNKVMFQINQELIPLNKIFAYYSNLTTDFSAGKDIRLYNMQPLVMKKLNEFIDNNLTGLNKMSYKQGKYESLSSINLSFETVCVYAYMCFKVIAGSIGIGDFTMYINAVNNFSGAISGFITQFFEYFNMCQYLDPFVKFLDIKPTTQNGIKNLNTDENHQKNDYTIEFKNVSFKYPNTENMVLNNVSVTLKPKQRISIVGPNGAGKTTFVKLLSRLYRPTSGRIEINGVDISEIDYNQYIKCLSIVFQDFKNYAFTIKENIALSETEISKDEYIEKILGEIGMAEKINEMDKGIYTSLYKIFDKDGIEFSGGEMQKIAISRAEFKNSPIILLDEPTSALDPMMEYEIMNNLNKIIKNKTALYISHRLSSCKFSDRILVFKAGEIVEDGTHSELMEISEGLYRDMFLSQAQYYQ